VHVQYIARLFSQRAQDVRLISRVHRQIGWQRNANARHGIHRWPRGRRDDPHVITSTPLFSRQCSHLGLDTTHSRCEAIRDMGHSHAGTVRHNAGVMSSTIAFVHAHPDDEALLTAGTMAKAAALGHRVILIMATDGAAGLTSADFAGDLAGTRQRELRASAQQLGVAAVYELGYADSGLEADQLEGFAQQPVAEIARRIVGIFDAESVDIAVGYDASGGYGHPDHQHVHVCTRAATVLAARPPRLFEATLPREPIASAARAAARLGLTPPSFDPAEFDDAWTPTAHITNRVNIRRFWHAKRNALRAHASQGVADDAIRTISVITRFPLPLLKVVAGYEYYVAIPHTVITSDAVTGNGSQLTR
jgi:LmbE family N-acetylglucosaminyl deacetylase